MRFWKNKIESRLRQANYSGGDIGQTSNWLLQALTGKTMAELLVGTYAFTSEQEQQLELWLHELLVLHKPLQYILGTVSFCGLSLEVRPPILIPRPETEQWVARLIDNLSRKNENMRILDLCTGSGCIALALARALPRSQVIGSDIAAHAIELAEHNKRALDLANVSFVRSNLFEQFIHQRVDLIVSNPPYVTRAEWVNLAPHVREWEDFGALMAGDDGLDLIRAIVRVAPCYAPTLVLEIGHRQAAAVCTLLCSCGYTKTEVWADDAGLDRVVLATIDD